MQSVTQLRALEDRMAGADAWRKEFEFLLALGFEVAQHRNGYRWRSAPDRQWSALPGATRDLERALGVAWIINPNITFVVDGSAPKLGNDVELFYAGHTFKGTHNDMAVACCRALLSYCIALQLQSEKAPVQ